MGVAVGGIVGVVATIAASSRVHEPAGVELPERAVEYGGGNNIVNVILVDVRAWDTMGELSVLILAATRMVPTSDQGSIWRSANQTLAGRSARRRMYHGYQCSP